MIRYALRCADGHDFESWFQSADAYDGLAARGMLNCAICGGGEVEKAMMAPKVSKAPGEEARDRPRAPSPAEAAIVKLRERVERESTWVGKRFAAEARAIHAGEGEDRPIWGEADAAEARALLEEGIPVAPLPFGPRRKMT